jgi:NAD(P)-dependent dehydrogenase (short-subunit alcohol dehydrogenase family)
MLRTGEKPRLEGRGYVMPDYLGTKVALVIGSGDETHRGVCVALAQAGALVAVAGAAPELSAEAALHSIANEVWALGKSACVITLTPDDASSVEVGLSRAIAELRGTGSMVVRVEP